MIFSKVADIFFPARCPGCDGINDTHSPLCSDCSEIMLHPSDKKSRCDICFMPAKECLCSKRQYFEKLCVPLYYENKTKLTLHRFKFRSRRDLAKAYAQLLVQSLNERDMLRDADFLTHIPMRPYDVFVRGYNQSKLIAEHMSKITGIPCASFLIKMRRTKKQHSLGKTARSGNLLGVFEPDKTQLDKLQNKTVIVIDDIITTGSTLNENAKTLLIFGAGKVYACACAVTKKSEKNH